MSARTRELLRADPGEPAGHRGLRGVFLSQDVRSKGVGGQNELDDASLTYGGDLPRAVLRRAPRHPRRAAARGPVPVPARRAAGLLRPGDDLPDRRRPRAPAGAVVRHRAAGCSPRRSSCCATTACSSATATSIALGGHRAAACSRGRSPPTNGAYLSIRVGSLSVQPAEFAKIAIVIFLASYLRDTRQVLVLGARRVPVRHDPAAEALRPGAGDLGRGDGAAVLHPGHRLVGDVLRRRSWRSSTSRPNRLSLRRRSGSALFAAGRLRALPGARPRSRTASTPGATRSTRALRQGRAAATSSRRSLFAQADGGMFGQGFGQALLDAARAAATLLPAPQTDFIYAVIVNELGLAGGLRAAARLPAGRPARLQDRDARPRLVLQAAGRRA